MEIKTAFGNGNAVYDDSMKIRTAVFIHEQKIDASIEQDENKNRCLYYVGYIENKPVTTARVIATKEGTLVQRVCTLKEYRQQGLSSQIFSAIEKDAKSNKVAQVWLFAQDHAQKFYLENGFKVVGDQVMEAGIAHHKMIKKIK
ncbi:GNAT family N-acetyltransferase [Pediococcus parvulus]|uniref:GNAT family N-acetyltransferase n=1 Tax=Pediococcus parvulus TaxID=54062 RepID=UPI0021A77B32|nr:GNAT family N-acetyltransferase [Pediococcus parvulus]MCT3035561.1 GNAT family N-acetyltransferase [Pediococcus parvulus]